MVTDRDHMAWLCSAGQVQPGHRLAGACHPARARRRTPPRGPGRSPTTAAWSIEGLEAEGRGPASVWVSTCMAW